VSTRVKILAAAVTLTVVAGGSAWAAEGFLGNPFGGGNCGMSPSGVVNQASGGGGARSLDISWTAPLPTSCGKLDHYNIVVIDAQGHPGAVLGTAKATATRAQVSGATLNLCTWYRLGIQSVLTSGQKSPVQVPAHAAFVSGPPDKVPPAIFVIINGTGNKGPADEIDPSTADFCTSPDGSFPQAEGTLEQPNPHQPNPAIQHLANSWLNIGDANAATRTSGAGNNLIDSLAATGGYVLPYSYTGINMTGDAADPHLTVDSFTSTDVATANPMGECTDVTCEGLGEPVLLQRSLESIHSVFRDTPVIVVGHSLGGLIAEQWWLQYSARNTEGVVQVISLDAPLNGVADAGCSTGPQCAAIAAILAASPVKFPVGTDPANAYTQLWENQNSDAGSSGYANNQTALALDAHNHLFTAIGDIGDPLYDMLDVSLGNNVTNRGLLSQVFWTEPSCAASGYDLTSTDCTAAGQAVINPCGHNMDDGGRFPFGLVNSIWIHSNVKNCPGVISDVLGWYNHALAHPTTRPVPATSTPTTVPPVNWANAANIDPGGGLVAVSCASGAFCVAVDGSNAFIYRDAAWGQAVNIDPVPELIDISCPTTTFCMAVGNQGDAVVYTNGSWAQPVRVVPPVAYIDSVSCPVANFCRAVDEFGDAITYRNGVWAAPMYADASPLTYISCPSTAFCMALDSAGNALQYTNGTWGQPVHIATSNNLLERVSCSSSAFCVATDNYNNVIIYTGVWAVSRTIDSNNDGYTINVSCPIDGYCMAVDYYNGDAFQYSAGNWSLPVNIYPPGNLGGNAVTGLSCTADDFCLAVDAQGNSVRAAG